MRLPSLPPRAAWPLILLAATVPLAAAPLAASADPATGEPVRAEPARPHDPAGGTPEKLAGGRPEETAQRPGGRLTLSTTDEAGGRRTLAATHARLNCHPTGGTHPRAADACAALDSAGGDFTRLPHKSAICTQEYAPVTAEAHGTWRGRAIHRKVTYDNRCKLSSNTGAVFDF